jgi:MFS family permease
MKVRLSLRLTPFLRDRSRHLPRNVTALGLVSLLMGASSYMIVSLLPVFLVTVVGASAAYVGWIEGIAEATNSAARILSGTLSDWLRRRKSLVVLGYGLAACVKPLFAIATDVSTVLAARFADRLGKGLRDAPRDALLADELPIESRGAGFGLRIALFTIGCVAGPLLASLVMLESGNDFRLVFWIAAVPAFLSVVVLVLGVTEPPHSNDRVVFSLEAIRHLPAALRWTIAVASILALARFSQAFLLLKAKDVGVDAALIPTFIMVMGLVYGITAFPCGTLADRVDRRLQLRIGIGVLFGCYLVLATADDPWQVVAGAALWGLQMGIIEGLMAAAVADAAPPSLRGTAFGLYYFCTGLASLAASAAAGTLWSAAGPSVAFVAGAAVAVAAGGMTALLPASGGSPGR